MISVYADLEALNIAAAEMFIEKAAMASAARGRFTVALSGGDTPAGLYTLLALPEFAGRVDWSRIHLFWGDERCVPATDPRNNAVNALKQFADLPLPPANIHRVNTALTAQQCALDYENEIRRHLGEADAVFDLILLGVGTDGHTASLFPYADAGCDMRLVNVAQKNGEDIMRVTFTPTLINQAACIMFLVSGANKANVMREVLQGAVDTSRLPAQQFCGDQQKVVWLLDSAAASLLKN